MGYLFARFLIYLINVFIQSKFFIAFHAIKSNRPSAKDELYFATTYFALHAFYYTLKSLKNPTLYTNETCIEGFISSFLRKNRIFSHQLHNFYSICEADMMKKPDQRYLIALQLGQPAFLQNALKVKWTVMCIRIKFYCFGGFFQHVCLTFYATLR